MALRISIIAARFSSGSGSGRSGRGGGAAASVGDCSIEAERSSTSIAGRGGGRWNSCRSGSTCRLSCSSSRSSSVEAVGSGIRPGVIDLAPVRTVPILTATGRRLIAGPRPRNWPRARSRIDSACRRSMPSRSAARIMSISRNVRPIRKLLASAATFLASLARRWVAITPARPRLRPRHMRLVIAARLTRRASSVTSPAAAGANICASSTTTSTGYHCSRGASNRALRNCAAHFICWSISSSSSARTTEARCWRMRAPRRTISASA